MSSKKRHELLVRLFDQACKLPEDERGAFIRKSCEDDPELLQELERLR